MYSYWVDSQLIEPIEMPPDYVPPEDDPTEPRRTIANLKARIVKMQLSALQPETRLSGGG